MALKNLEDLDYTHTRTYRHLHTTHAYTHTNERTRANVVVSSVPPCSILFRFQDEADELPLVSRVIYRLAHYEGGMLPNSELVDDADEPETPDATEADGQKKTKKKTPKKSANQVAFQRPMIHR